MSISREIANKIKIINNVRTVARNWINIIFDVKANNFPINVHYRDGGIVTADSWHELTRFISEKRYNIRLKSRKGVGDFLATFILEEYKFLECRRRLVIDIGAEIGDSSIYFAIKGATKVIAIEPMPYNFYFIKENVKLNGFDGVIEPLNIMVGSQTKRTMIEISNESIVRDAIETKQGFEIYKLALGDLLKKYGATNAILKMDCEGCEYNLINIDDETLQNFERIQIEYHYGLDGLVDKLHGAGFKIKYTKQMDVYNPDASKPYMQIGYIYAKQMSDSKRD
jgi:FkbM family methyltransferase